HVGQRPAARRDTVVGPAAKSPCHPHELPPKLTSVELTFRVGMLHIAPSGFKASAGDVAPRAPAVVAGLSRQAERPFGDDGALDLVAAARDPVAGGTEDVLGPGVGPPFAGIGDEAGAEE